jgi:hypothetical protein
MKKIFLIILAALISAACGSPPTNRADTSSTSSTNKPAEMTAPASVAVTEAEATANEKAIWGTIEKQDLAAFGDMLADDFVYVTGDGAHDKAGTIKSVTGYKPTDIVFSDWKFVPVGKSAGLLTFSVKNKGTMNGEPIPETSMRASSLWVKRGGKLLAVYHQDSEVKTAPPPPPAKAGAKPTASPAAPFVAATLSADAEANEKAVWAAFSAKQWNVFGSYLSSDFIEVEEEGVYDHAGAVKGVEGFDFSKAALSAWRQVKVDDEASLVTYTVKMPGAKPDTWYHSSVWSTRNGKWLAVFHQGTPMAPPQPPAKSTAKKTE